MEGTGPRRRWNKRAPMGTVLLFVCMFIPAVAQTCRSDEFRTEDGICCSMCHPGYKLLKKCQSKELRSNCTKCPAGQYMDKPNYSPNCISCKRCRSSRSEIEISPCKSSHDTICGCKDGYYKSIIDSRTFECLKCKDCELDEREKQKCLPNSNTVCQCKEQYYRDKGKCQLCRNCTDGCKHLCPKESTSAAPKDENTIKVVAGVAAGAGVLFVLMVIITHVVTKWQVNRKILTPSSQSSDVSLPLSEQGFIQSEESFSSSTVEAVPPHAVFVDRELSNLPDCVPLEIRTSDLIYMVLDVVPVTRVKQLVRSLNVTDKEIEWAEMDHRSCKEAHYQMLRVWAERGSRAGGGGRGGMLHQPLLQELLDKLRLMHLGQAAEELETKYSIQ